MDRRAGIIATVVAQAHFKGKFKPEDFMPKKPRKRQTVQEQLAVVEGIMEGMKDGIRQHR